MELLSLSLLMVLPQSWSTKAYAITTTLSPSLKRPTLTVAKKTGLGGTVVATTVFVVVVIIVVVVALLVAPAGMPLRDAALFLREPHPGGELLWLCVSWSTPLKKESRLSQRAYRTRGLVDRERPADHVTHGQLADLVVRRHQHADVQLRGIRGTDGSRLCPSWCQR